MIVIGERGAHVRGLGGAIGEYLTLGRSRVSSTVGAKPFETRFLEGSHSVKSKATYGNGHIPLVTYR